MISTRYIRIVGLLIGLALFPTITHTYLGLTEKDGLSASTIGLSLVGLNSDRQGRGRSVEKAFDSHDWIERRYTQPNDADLRLVVARTYNHKRLYHHPEKRLLRGINLESLGTKRVSDQPDIPLHLLKSPTGSSQDMVVYSLLYDNHFIDNPFQFLIRNVWPSLFHRRKPMTLFFVHDSSAIANIPLSKSRAVRLLLEAIDDFRSQEPDAAT